MSTQEFLVYDPLLYWEARAEHWLGQDHQNPEWEAEIKSRLNPDWNVLELGCGDGRWSELFPKYTGCDISPTLLVEASKRHPGKSFAHHDMREGVSGDKWGLIFTFTSWLHMPPRDIAKVRLPDTSYLFVEPHAKATAEHCFRHDYSKLFGTKPLKRIGKLTMHGRGL